MKKAKTKQKGFTLLEVLLVGVLTAIVFVAGVPLFRSFQVRNDADIAIQQYVSSLRRAQTLSLAVDGDTSWGVKIVPGEITLFQGSSYVARNAALDEVTSIPSGIAVSGMIETVYGKFTGIPQTVGTTTLATESNETRNVTLHTKGMVSY